VAQPSNSSHHRLIIEVPRSNAIRQTYTQTSKHAHTHKRTHTVGLLRTNDQVVAEAATYTTEQIQNTNVLVLSGIRTCNVSNRAAAEPLIICFLLLGLVMLPFLQISTPKSCMHFACLLCVLNALPVSFFWNSKFNNFDRSTNHEHPNYVNFRTSCRCSCKLGSIMLFRTPFLNTQFPLPPSP
jgi:hypothetical protein